METKEGIIQAIKKDRTALEIENIWFQSKFKGIPTDINKGDSVKVSYTKNNDFNNVKSIVKIQQEVPEEKNKTETKIDWKVTENRELKEKIAGMMTSYVKDIAVAVITNSQDYKDINLVIDNATKELIKAYKEIIKNL